MIYSEYDVVEIVALKSGVPNVSIGDTGAILMVYELIGSEQEYEDESVLPDGSNKWMGTFKSSDIKLRSTV